MSKRINSRQKGKRGERAFRDILREAGYKAERGQQHKGGSDSPDVICPDLPEIHWEVKCCESGNPYNWLEQAEVDAGTWMHVQHGRMLKIPVVAHKRNGQDWIAVMSMRRLLEIIRRSDLPKVSNPKHVESDIFYLDSMGIHPHDGKGKISIPSEHHYNLTTIEFERRRHMK